MMVGVVLYSMSLSTHGWGLGSNQPLVALLSGVVISRITIVPIYKLVFTWTQEENTSTSTDAGTEISDHNGK